MQDSKSPQYSQCSEKKNASTNTKHQYNTPIIYNTHITSVNNIIYIKYKFKIKIKIKPYIYYITV